MIFLVKNGYFYSMAAAALSMASLAAWALMR
jgi:hypothetical protein